MATICLVSLCIALYTVPKLPVPSFSKRVYWLSGLLLGIGMGSLGRLGSEWPEGVREGFGW